MTKNNNAPLSDRFNIGQDWASVVTGFILILFVVITGYAVATPSFGGKAGWNFDHDFTGMFGASSLWTSLLFTLMISVVTATIGMLLSGEKIRNYFTGFVAIFLLVILAQFVSSFAGFKNLGLETVLFSLIIGLLIGNFIRLPEWLRSGVQTELYVKIGLVLLGATILFRDILTAGAFGLIQAVIVVTVVWYFAFWLSRKMKVDDEFSTMLASAVSICGVSAAIATAGAINGDKKKLSFIISLVLIIAIPMMIFLPVIAKWMGLSEVVTGAWLGGTIDTTGAVVAAGTIAGETGLKYATIVKFSQNVLLGLAAFAISIFWAYRSRGAGEKGQHVPVKIIWDRFPKFVLGFILASLIFSFILSPGMAESSGKVIKSFSTFWFNLAFISIGLETRFADFKQMESRKPFYSFLIAQTFNIIFTLGVSCLLFQLINTNIK
ncbi:MAG TPA: putative sulfate exporter family transporter [Bacteroidales bacterium]|nr:putative sulfate exporter family transporter [Bacteroidales bacterium]HOR09435.1 putative sulfate exporter family transporter [Bacteroidales bacterium]HPK84210.1 putative sulfate exporter family transporter [Bacteroidales bacterium]